MVTIVIVTESRTVRWLSPSRVQGGFVTERGAPGGRRASSCRGRAPHTVLSLAGPSLRLE
jgi:hypothetical protein